MSDKTADEILGKIFAHGVAFERDELVKTKFSHDYLTSAEAKAQLLAAELERIGEDEDAERLHVSHFIHTPECQPQLDMWIRDDFRAELRAAAKEYWK